MVTLYRMIPHYEILAQYSFSSPGSRGDDDSGSQPHRRTSTLHIWRKYLKTAQETELRCSFQPGDSDALWKESDVEKGKCRVIMIYEGEDGSREEDAGIVLIK